MTPYHTTGSLVILAPNWLGDAVMALPAIADIRRGLPDARITVAARPAISPLFALVPGVDDVLTLPARGWRDGTAVLADHGFDTAVLLPNSWHAALLAVRGKIPERWGYRADLRGRLLTRAIERPRDVHQAAYYQSLTRALGFPSGAEEPRLPATDRARDAASALLRSEGWNGVTPLVAIAPGAAYGGAKRWPPESFASLAAGLADDGVRTVMIGSAADRGTADAVTQSFSATQSRSGVIDLVGRTSLEALCGVLAACRALVTNDSGAMHLAAALGTRVTAVFGPTNEHATRPLGAAHTILTHDTWCRPCMLRECPLDHACMRGVAVAPVLESARRAI